MKPTLPQIDDTSPQLDDAGTAARAAKERADRQFLKRSSQVRAIRLHGIERQDLRDLLMREIRRLEDEARQPYRPTRKMAFQRRADAWRRIYERLIEE